MTGTNNGTALFDLCCRRPGNTSIYDSANSHNNRLNVSNSNSGGFFLGKANSSTAKLYRAGTEIGTKAMSVHSMPNYELYSYGFNEQNTTIYYTTRDCAFFWIGLGLTDTEAANLSTAVQTFQTTLSRQV